VREVRTGGGPPDILCAHEDVDDHAEALECETRDYDGHGLVGWLGRCGGAGDGARERDGEDLQHLRRRHARDCKLLRSEG
jgi:hypothetical protein